MKNMPQNRVSNAPVLYKSADQLFSKKVLQLFMGKNHGHLGLYEYSTPVSSTDPVRGSFYWSEFVRKSSAYYLPQQEADLIQTYVKNISYELSNTATLLDFGMGSSEALMAKTVPFLNSLQRIKNYIPVDISVEFVDRARITVRRIAPQISIYPKIADFFQDRIIFPVELPIAALFMGGSIANIEGSFTKGIPQDRVVKILKHFSRTLGKNGHFIIPHDTNQNGDEVLNSYIHPDHSKMEENFMYRAQRDCNISGHFDPSAWHYEPVWIAESSQLCHTIIADEEQSFSLDGYCFSFPKGHRLHLDNSFKYPVDLFQDMAQKAGFEVIKTYTKKDNHIALHVLRAT